MVKLNQEVVTLISFPTFLDNCPMLSLLLMYFGGLYCKQIRPRSDCSLELIVFASMVKLV